MVFTCAVCLDFVYDRLKPVPQPEQPSPALSSSASDLEPVNKQARLSFESNENGASGGVGVGPSTSTSNSNPNGDNGPTTTPPSPPPSLGRGLGLTVQDIVNFSIDLDPDLHLPEPSVVSVIRRRRGRPSRISSKINSTTNGQSATDNVPGSSSSSRPSLSPLESQLKEILKPIKSDADQIIVTHCGHIFHLACLSRWLDSLGSAYNGHCPECKRAIRSRKFTRIYPHDQEVAPLVEELETAKEREAALLRQIEIEKESKHDYMKYREAEIKYQLGVKDDRIAEQTQQIKFLINKLDSYQKNGGNHRFDCNGTLIDLTDDKTIIEVDISSSEDEMEDQTTNEAINIPQTNEQGEIVLD